LNLQRDGFGVRSHNEILWTCNDLLLQNRWFLLFSCKRCFRIFSQYSKL